MAKYDQNFKNLILDYLRESIEFFVPEEARAMPPGTVFTAIREEQLKERLGDRFFELDVPVKAEFPDGTREVLYFCIEINARDLKPLIRRHLIYAAQLSELYDTERVVPVAIFIDDEGPVVERFQLKGDQRTYLDFWPHTINLKTLNATEHLGSTNVVERICLPLMNRLASQKLEVVYHSLDGLYELDENAERRRKYLDFVLGYSSIQGAESQELARKYLQRGRLREDFMTIQQEWLLEGKAAGLKEGRTEGRTEGKIDLVFDLLRSGVLNAAQAREHLNAIGAQGEVAHRLVNEALKQLPA